MIPKETAEEIIASARIDDVIGDFVTLKKKGNYYVGLCPFHNEKTPSFTVTPAKGIFKCFGCGKGGDSVSFIMEHEHFNYPEALKYLAKKYNIEIVESHAQQEEESGEREVLYQLYQLAQKFYTDYLHNNEEGRNIGLSYFRERGFSDEMITLFQLGFAPRSWDSFTKFALEKGYTKEQLVSAGLSIAKDDRMYDRFRERVMFPVHTISGRTIAFGGRVMGKAENTPKYINSPESEIYNKSKTLYGIHLARKNIAQDKNCALVEGYTDVISLYQAGVQNAVASSGTSLTTEQIRLIRRYADAVTILYDGDAAGIKASFRGIDMILEEGLRVKIVLFPDGLDPDSFASTRSPEEVQAYIADNAKDFIRFKTQMLIPETLNDPLKKVAAIKDIVKSVALVPDSISRSMYVKDCAKMLEIEEKILIHEINVIRSKKNQDYIESINPNTQTTETPAEKLAVPVTSINDEVEKDVIFFLLHFGDKELVFKEKVSKREVIETRTNLTRLVVDELAEEVEFRNPVLKKIFQIYQENINAEKIPEHTLFLNESSKEVADMVVSILSSPYVLSLNWWNRQQILVQEVSQNLEASVLKAIYSMKLREVTGIISGLYKDLKQASSEERMTEILTELNRLDVIKKEIASKLGGRIIIK